MFIELSAEQQALRDEVRAYFGSLLSEAEREALLTERHGTVYREVVRRMGRDGWLGVGWPREYGGRGASPVQVAIFNMEDARSRALQPINRVGINLAVQDAVAAANAQVVRQLDVVEGQAVHCAPPSC